MRAYIIRRVLLMILTMFLVSLIIFFMIRLIPGSIVDMIIQNVALVTPATRHAVEHELGLDVPAHVQYVRWMGNIIIHGDLGNSLWTKAPVIEEIAARWPVTLELGLLGFIVAQLIALPIGVYSALRQDTWGDYIGRSFAIMCIAVPAFWLATMVIVFPSIWWGYMPPIMLIPFIEDPIGNLQMFIMPSVIAGMFMSGMARERVVILRHALKNALIPVITIVGLQVPGLIGGTVIIEQIFCLPGMGRLIVEATAVRDYTMISGVLLVFGTVMVVTNLMVDLTYAYLDPRVHYR